jgi:hypothetical protein
MAVGPRLREPKKIAGALRQQIGDDDLSPVGLTPEEIRQFLTRLQAWLSERVRLVDFAKRMDSAAWFAASPLVDLDLNEGETRAIAEYLVGTETARARTTGTMAALLVVAAGLIDVATSPKEWESRRKKWDEALKDARKRPPRRELLKALVGAAAQSVRRDGSQGAKLRRDEKGRTFIAVEPAKRDERERLAEERARGIIMNESGQFMRLSPGAAEPASKSRTPGTGNR